MRSKSEVHRGILFKLVKIKLAGSDNNKETYYFTDMKFCILSLAASNLRTWLKA